MSKHTVRAVTFLAAAVGWASTAGLAASETYPTKPVRMIAPYPPGGTSDIVARIVSQKLIEAWGERVIVDNRPGASGSLGTEVAAKSAADGYTLLIGSVAPIVLNPLFYKVSYDSLRDFEPISLIGAAPQLIVINSSLPVKSMKELIAYAKAAPEGLNYGTSGVGTLPHLGGEMFKVATGAKMVHVTYKGTVLSMTDLVGGRLHVVFSDLPVALPYVQSGKLRALAVTGAKPFSLTPGVPTAIEAGLPGFVLDNWWGLLTLKGTPPAIVTKLNSETVKALKQPEIQKSYASLGLEAVTSTPRGFADAIRSDLAKFIKVIKDAGIKVEVH